MKTIKAIAAFAVSVGLALTAGSSAAQGPPGLPSPILYLKSMEYYSTGGGNFVRYVYDVMNKQAYPAAMFAPAPGLPPCGNNTNSSRTWVDFFENRTNRRIYGFCALGNPSNLDGIWFAVPEGTVPPSYIYIELIDRQTNTRYRSNLAETVL